MQRVLLAVLAVGMLLGWLAREPGLTLGGDEATYVVLSQSLAEGRYHDEYLVGTPRHAKYPPVMPAWLLAIRALGGESHEVPRAVHVILLALVALLVGDAVRRIGSPLLGLGAAAAVVHNPATSFYAGTLLSETLFTALTVAALWMLLSVAGERAGSKWIAAAVGLIMLAVFTRSVGIALLGAMALTMLIRRRILAAVGVIVAAAIAVAGWGMYVRGASQHSLGRNYRGEVAYSLGLAGSDNLFKHAFENATTYLTWVPGSDFGLPTLENTPIDNLAWLLVLGVPLVAGTAVLLRRWFVAAAYAAGYAAILLVWPFPDGRLAAPLLPIAIAAIVLGVARLAGGQRRPKRAALAGLAAGLVLATLGAITTAQEALRILPCRGEDTASRLRCLAPPQQAWMRAAHLLRDSLPDRFAVATVHPAPLYLQSGRSGVPWERLYHTSSDSLLVPEGPVGYALITDMGWGDQEEPWPEVLAKRCGTAVTRDSVVGRTSLIGLGSGPGECRILFQASH